MSLRLRAAILSTSQPAISSAIRAPWERTCLRWTPCLTAPSRQRSSTAVDARWRMTTPLVRSAITPLTPFVSGGSPSTHSRTRSARAMMRSPTRTRPSAVQTAHPRLAMRTGRNILRTTVPSDHRRFSCAPTKVLRTPCRLHPHASASTTLATIRPVACDEVWLAQCRASRSRPRTTWTSRTTAVAMNTRWLSSTDQCRLRTPVWSMFVSTSTR